MKLYIVTDVTLTGFVYEIFNSEYDKMHIKRIFVFTFNAFIIVLSFIDLRQSCLV
jgi:hypothetical protein